MRILLLLTALLGLGACKEEPAPAKPDEMVPLLREGLTSYRANRVAEAERIFARLVADPEIPAFARATASRELARISWLIDGESDKALDHIETARRTGDDICETDLLAARIMRASGRRDTVIERAPEWALACNHPQIRDEIRLQMIEARLDLAADGPQGAQTQLGAAVADLAELSEDGAASFAGARAGLEIGLLTGDAELALRGWRDYFWLTRTNMPQAMTRLEGAGIFENALKPDAGDESRLALTNLLVHTGFAQTAERYANQSGLAEGLGGTPDWRRIAEYFRQRKELEAATLRVYRGLARGRDTGDELEQAAGKATAALMQAAGKSGDPRLILFENYGLFGTSGKTNNYPSLHVGHVIEDRQQKVSQYGHEGVVRLIVLDNMLSNGFESWLWDGWAATGGWASTGDWTGAKGGIVQVRPEYVKAPFRAWLLLGDGPARREFIADHAAHAAEDLAVLRRKPVAHMPGVNDRLRLQAIDRIAAAANALSGDGGDFRRAFLDEYYRGVMQHSIHIHEGRHVIDKTLPGAEEQPFDSVELEYRGKLSELALSDYPRLALRIINSSDVGGKSNHGRANSKILGMYRTWIRDHSAQVIGFDPDYPPLAQIDKLTDNQIRMIARNADPLAE